MRFFGIKFTIKREPRPPKGLPVILASVQEAMVDWLKAYEVRLDLLEKKAEATRRKVYRDYPATESEGNGAAEVEPLPRAARQAGDIVDPRLL